MIRGNSELGRLEKEACLSLDWVSARLESFSPIRGRKFSEARIKAFAELAILYAWLHRSGQPLISRYLPALENFIATECSKPSFAELARKRPHLAFPCLVPYLMLRIAGHRDSFYEQTIARVQEFGHFCVSEVVPYRTLEREYVLWTAGVLPKEPAWLRLYRGTSLHSCRSSLFMDDEAAYSVTHTLFYLTDFGYKAFPFANGSARRAADVVESLLLHYWRVGHWDLVGELLTNLNCLGQRGSVIYSGAAEAFSRVRLPDGAVPPVRRESPATTRRSSPAPTGAFWRFYHSTLVSILHCGTAIHCILKRGHDTNA